MTASTKSKGPKVVLAFAGAIGSGKSTLSEGVADALGWPRASFGDFIRKQARNPDDRNELQRIGQTLVLTDVEKFVDDVLSEAPGWEDAGGLVIDGIRHVEVRLALIYRLKPHKLKLVFVTVNEDMRYTRAQDEHQIDAKMLPRYDQHLTEAQIPRILPEYADLRIDNNLPVEFAVERVIKNFDLERKRTMAAAE
jgi:cytidylate kinase